MKSALPALCLLFTVQSFSQMVSAQSMDSLKSRYTNETLHFFRGWLAKGQNEERIRFADMKKLFALSPEADKTFNLFRKQRTTAIILSPIALACMVTGAYIVHNNPKNFAGSFLVGFGVGIDAALLPVIFGSSNKLHHAVWLYNRDMLFSAK